MRKFPAAMLIFLAALPLFSYPEYQGTLRADAGVKLTYLAGDIGRTSFRTGAELDPIGIKFDENRLSLPLSVHWASESLRNGQLTYLNDYISFGVGIAYTREITELLSFKTKIGTSIRYYADVHGALAAFDVSAELMVIPLKHLAFSFPIVAEFSSNEFTLLLSCGMTLLF